MVTCVSVAKHARKQSRLLSKSGCLFISCCLAYERELGDESAINTRIAQLWDQWNNLLTKNKTGDNILMNRTVANKIKDYYNYNTKDDIIGFSYGKGNKKTHFVVLRDNRIIDTSINSSSESLELNAWLKYTQLTKGDIKIFTVRQPPYSL